MRARFVQVLCVAACLLIPVTVPAADNSYTIREGETLFSIAKKAQVPVDVLRACNGITDASRVKAGTLIRIPAVRTVRKGDTLFGIAREMDVPLAALMELNHLSKSARIKAGDRLYMPLDVGGQGGAPRAQVAATDALGEAAPPTVSAARQVDSLVWPHPGRHEPVSGKISGLVFFGARGDPVYSASAGEVKWVAPYWGLGKVVLIKAADGSIFTYWGNEEILVNVGDRVTPGAEIARLGESPQGGGARLYFSIKDAKGQVIEPEKYFSAKSQA
jgi:murein DD-endopeptidase MepM/ murein hydrolase activator NlpD